MKYVTTSPKAGVYHDQATGITIYPRQVTELTEGQFSSRKIQAAIAGGHLIIVQNNPSEKEHELTAKKLGDLDKKIKAQYKRGTSIPKIAENLTLDNAKALAKLNDITTEESDTVETILEAILTEEE
jgi:hypothetical protein